MTELLEPVPRSCSAPQLDAGVPAVEKHVDGEVAPFPHCGLCLLVPGRSLPLGAGTDMWVAQMPSLRCDAESDEAPRCRVCFEPGALEDQKEVTLHLGPRNCQLCFHAAYRSLVLGHADIPYYATKTDCGLMLQDGELIEPCACKGTQRYVHKSCLVRWQATFFSIRRSPPFSSSPAYPRERERERERDCGRVRMRFGRRGTQPW